MTCHRVCNYINTTGATSGAGTAYNYPSGAPTVFSGVRVTRSLVLCVCFVAKGKPESVYHRRTDNTMAKRKSTTGQTTFYKTHTQN
jgi:hypothetical protein